MNKARFAPTHEWVIIEDDVATVGLSRFGKEELGEIVSVQLPEVGKKLNAGEEMAILESTKAACDLYAPLSGVVMQVNSSLNTSCTPLNEEPESRGWLCKLKITRPEEVTELLTHDDYLKLVT